MSAHQSITLDLDTLAKGLSAVDWVNRWSGLDTITADWFYEGEQEPKLAGVTFNAGTRAITMNLDSLAVIFGEVGWVLEWSEGEKIECAFHYAMNADGYENADGVEFRSGIENEARHASR